MMANKMFCKRCHCDRNRNCDSRVLQWEREIGLNSRKSQPSKVLFVIKNHPDNEGDIREAGSIPQSERSPGGGHGNPLQYSLLENSMERGAWWPTIHGLGRSPGEGNGNPLQYSWLENPMDRGAWWATVHGVGKS